MNDAPKNPATKRAADVSSAGARRDSPPPFAGETPAARCDRVQIIRSSLRCFIFGLIGVVPFLGLILAALAFRLGRKVTQETGDRISFKFLHVCWICGLVLTFLYFVAIGPNAAIAVALIFLGVQNYLLFAQFRNFSPREWNPARHLVFWGMGLAYTGIVLSVGTLIVVLIAVANNQ